jgi:hypothetical protein
MGLLYLFVLPLHLIDRSTARTKIPVNIRYNDFVLCLVIGELGGMYAVSSITGLHILRRGGGAVV